ncbi:MAG: hypothetical protein R6T98_13240 [Desulfatiglandales bacterium]
MLRDMEIFPAESRVGQSGTVSSSDGLGAMLSPMRILIIPMSAINSQLCGVIFDRQTISTERWMVLILWFMPQRRSRYTKQPIFIQRMRMVLELFFTSLFATMLRESFIFHELLFTAPFAG